MELASRNGGTINKISLSFIDSFPQKQPPNSIYREIKVEVYMGGRGYQIISDKISDESQNDRHATKFYKRLAISTLAGIATLGAYFVYTLLKTLYRRNKARAIDECFNDAAIKALPEATIIIDDNDNHYESTHLSLWNHIRLNYERDLGLIPELDKLKSRNGIKKTYIPAFG